jgi:beta-fructofuranosidase
VILFFIGITVQLQFGSTCLCNALQIDHSIIESFGGEGRACITNRVYPKLAIQEEARLFIFNNGTLSVTISSLNAWSMNKAQINHKENFI